jgi:hypothetical protein
VQMVGLVEVCCGLAGGRASFVPTRSAVMFRKQWRGVRTELSDELVTGLFRIAFELGNL